MPAAAANTTIAPRAPTVEDLPHDWRLFITDIRNVHRHGPEVAERAFRFGAKLEDLRGIALCGVPEFADRYPILTFGETNGPCGSKYIIVDRISAGEVPVMV